MTDFGNTQNACLSEGGHCLITVALFSCFSSWKSRLTPVVLWCRMQEDEGGSASQDGAQLICQGSTRRLTLLLGVNQGGRSTLLSYLLASFFPTAEQYKQHLLNQGRQGGGATPTDEPQQQSICTAVPEPDELEAICMLRCVQLLHADNCSDGLPLHYCLSLSACITTAAACYCIAPGIRQLASQA